MSPPPKKDLRPGEEIRFKKIHDPAAPVTFLNTKVLLARVARLLRFRCPHFQKQAVKTARSFANSSGAKRPVLRLPHHQGTQDERSGQSAVSKHPTRNPSSKTGTGRGSRIPADSPTAILRRCKDTRSFRPRKKPVKKDCIISSDRRTVRPRSFSSRPGPAGGWIF